MGISEVWDSRKKCIQNNYIRTCLGGSTFRALPKKDKDDTSGHEENSIDQFSGGVDFLMDENILTNESREEEDSQNVRTPNGIKNLNVNSINAINSAGFSNHQAMKKMKGSNKVINNSKTNGQSNIGKEGKPLHSVGPT